VNFKSSPISIIKIILEWANCSMDRERFGYDRLFQRSIQTNKSMGEPSDYRYLDSANHELSHDSKTVEGDANPEIFAPGVQISLGREIHMQFPLHGRATHAQEITTGTNQDSSSESRPQWMPLVLKSSYLVTTRELELAPNIIKMAREVNPVRTPVVPDADHLPGNKVEGKSHTKPGNDACEKRRLVVITMKKYRHAYDLAGEDLLKAFSQLVLFEPELPPFPLVGPHLHFHADHRRLFAKGNILHRNLSLQDFLCYKAPDGWNALLNDFDLAIHTSNGPSRLSASKHRAGTPPYMARELLFSEPLSVAVAHVYTHELESLFYLLLFIALGYTGSIPDGDTLKGFRSQTWMYMAEQKDLFFTSAAFRKQKLHQVRITVMLYPPSLIYSKGCRETCLLYRHSPKTCSAIRPSCEVC
jgi:serine/threonine protein kinase